MNTRCGVGIFVVAVFALGVSIAVSAAPISAQSSSFALPARGDDEDPLPTNTPRADGTIMHKISVGDTAWDIAVRYGMSLADLYYLNGIDEDSVLYVGDELRIIPGKTPTPETTQEETMISITPTMMASATSVPTLTPTPTGTPVAIPMTGQRLKEEMATGLVLAGFGISAVLILLCATFCLRNKPWRKKG